jgi:hypothetical protein
MLRARVRRRGGSTWPWVFRARMRCSPSPGVRVSRIPRGIAAASRAEQERARASGAKHVREEYSKTARRDRRRPSSWYSTVGRCGERGDCRDYSTVRHATGSALGGRRARENRCPSTHSSAASRPRARPALSDAVLPEAGSCARRRALSARRQGRPRFLARRRARRAASGMKFVTTMGASGCDGVRGSAIAVGRGWRPRASKRP